jgi:hypothetical protein
MLFWELVTVVRPELDEAKRALSDPRWATYSDWVRRFPELVHDQRREILDSEVPPDLARALLAVLKTRYRVRDGWLREALLSETQTLSAVEVYDRYGGHCLQEVYEYSSYRVD